MVKSVCINYANSMEVNEFRPDNPLNARATKSQDEIQGLGCDGNILCVPAVIIALAVLSDVIVREGRLIVAIA